MISDRDEQDTEQVWITMAASEVVRDRESCQSKKTIHARDKDVEK